MEKIRQDTSPNALRGIEICESRVDDFSKKIWRKILASPATDFDGSHLQKLIAQRLPLFFLISAGNADDLFVIRRTYIYTPLP
jgi:hypothetical protein